MSLLVNHSETKSALFIENGQGRITRKWLRNGKPGNLSTMREMRQLVRDSLGLDGQWLDEGLREKAVEICQTFSARSWEERVNAIFLFVKELVYYIPDPAGGNDDIENARQVIRLGFADCDGKAVCLSTLLALVGVNTAFKAARYAKVDGYQHVYVIAYNALGVGIPLDPTYVNSYVGWEARALESVTLPVSGESDQVELDRARLGDISSATAARITGAGINAASAAAHGQVTSAIVSGATLAVSFIPVVGPFLAPVVGLIAGLFHHGPTAEQKKLGSDFDVADKQVAAYLLTLNAKADAGTLTGSDVAEAASQVTQLAQLAQDNMARDASGYVKKQWDAEASRYATWLRSLSDKVTPGSEGTAAAAVPGADLNSVATAAGVSVNNSIASTISSALTLTKPSGELDYGKVILIGLAGFAVFKLLGSQR